MIQLNLGAPAQFMPALPGPTPAGPTMWPRPQTMAAFPSGTATSAGCGYGYKMVNGVCMSDGCVTGRSPCVVTDPYGKTCSYDQLMAYQSQSGVKACGPAPILPPPPQTPTVPAPPNVQPQTPAVVVDVSPNPGTQVVATTPIDQITQAYPVAGFKVPVWALALGGLAVIGIIVALLRR